MTMMMNTANTTFLLAILALLSISTLTLTNAAEEGTVSQTELAAKLMEFDVPDEEVPDCFDEESPLEKQICPTPDNEGINCGPIDEIESYCATLLGDDIVTSMKGVDKEVGKNAMEGCIRYVGFHVFDDNHIACCPSETCEDWIDEQFEMFVDMEDDEEDMEGAYYDDHDDEDDDELHGDEF